MQSIQENQQPACRVQFLDTLGYYDLGVEILGVIISFYVVWQCVRNYHQLRKERCKTQSNQYQKSIIRKTIVNWISIVYILTFILSSFLSFTLFLIYISQGPHDIKQFGLNDWYKFTQVLYINILNTLNLTVGFLYWMACRAYSKKPGQQIATFLGKGVRYIFFFIYALNAITIVVFLIYFILTYEKNQIYTDQQVSWMDVGELIGVVLSSLMCLTCRIYYQRKVLSTLNLTSSVRKKQKIVSALIFVSVLLRIMDSVADCTIDSDDQFARFFNQDCIDVLPYHALIISVIIFVVDLMPPYLFCRIFNPGADKKKIEYKTQQEQDLHQRISDQNQSNTSIDYM